MFRYELRGIRATSYPPKLHPMGWDAFKIKLSIDDLTKSGVRGLPGIEIDVAAPRGIAGNIGVASDDRKNSSPWIYT